MHSVLQTTVWECVESLFAYHNETLNIYSHLLPFVLHAWWLVSDHGLDQDPLRVVAFPYQVMVTICMLCSSAYHTFMSACTSPEGYKLLLSVDVGSVAASMAAAGLNVAWLPLACVSPFWKLGFFLGGGALGITLVLKAKNVVGRGLGFLLLVGMVAGGVALRMFTEFGGTKGDSLWIASALLTTIGGFLNATRIPERWGPPGFWDFHLNSHTLMHLMTAASSFCCLQATIYDIEESANLSRLHQCAMEQWPLPTLTRWLT